MVTIYKTIICTSAIYMFLYTKERSLLRKYLHRFPNFVLLIINQKEKNAEAMFLYQPDGLLSMYSFNFCEVS